MPQWGWGAIGVRSVLASRPFCMGSRMIGGVLVVLGMGLVSVPALADQQLVAADNGTVPCVASARDLTRFSLKDDQFASV